MPSLHQHILGAGQIVSWRFCAWSDVPISLLENLPGYRRLVHNPCTPLPGVFSGVFLQEPWEISVHWAFTSCCKCSRIPDVSSSTISLLKPPVPNSTCPSPFLKLVLFPLSQEDPCTPPWVFCVNLSLWGLWIVHDYPLCNISCSLISEVNTCHFVFLAPTHTFLQFLPAVSFAFWSNLCSFLCLWELFWSALYCCILWLRELLEFLLVCFLGPLFWSAILVWSVQVLPVFQSSTEVVCDRRVWGQSWACSLQRLINGMGGLGCLTGSELAVWLSKEAEAGRIETGVFPDIEDLESGVPHRARGHSPLGSPSLCSHSMCSRVSLRLWEDRKFWRWCGTCILRSSNDGVGC